MRAIRHPAPGSRTLACAAAAACAISFAAAGAPAAQPDDGAYLGSDVPWFWLIAPDLTIQLGAVTAWTAAGLRIADHTGLEREVPRSRVAAVVPEWWAPAAEGGPQRPLAPPDLHLGAFVELTDGQRFIGQPAGRDAGADILAWNHPRLGQLTLPLERVSRIFTGLGGAITASPRASDEADLDEDVVLLVNGDRVTGLIESVGANVVVSTGNAGAGSTVEIPFDRVREITLVNPPAIPSGVMLWFSDGTTLRGDQIDARTGSPGTGGAIVLEVRPDKDLGSQEGVWRLADLEAANFDAAAVRPLAAMRITSQGQAPGASRRLIPPARSLPEAVAGAVPPLGAADIELPGPMFVDWTVPEGTVRLAGWAELPENCRAWGDCEVWIGLVGPGGEAREVWRRRINAESPIARFDVPVTGQTVRVAVEPGERGPIQDRIILRRPLIAVEPR